MAVELNPGWRGIQVKSPKVMNKLIRGLAFQDRDFVLEETKKCYLNLTSEVFREKIVFSYYKDINIEFPKTRSAGPCYQSFIKYYKLAEGAEIPKEMFLVHGGKIWVNEEFTKKWVKCWAYDINSAYPNALLSDIPDVNNNLGAGLIEEGQVGFRVSFEDGYLEEITSGYSEYRFNLIESPFKKYVSLKYSQLQWAKSRGDKEAATNIKLSMNSAIGVLRNHNPFLYCHIITTARNYIEKYIDENTISVNTDCIYSAAPRSDIPLGSDIGLFKELPQNGSEIFFRNTNYIWKEDKESSLRGVPSEFHKVYNIETGEIEKEPDFYWDSASLSIRRIDK